MTIVNTKNLSDRYKLSKGYISKLCQQGEIKYITKLSSGYLFDLDDPALREFEQIRRLKIKRNHALALVQRYP